MILNIEKKVRNEQDTLNFADELASKIELGTTLLLEGNLGAGKTFLVNAICKNWGITEVSSPTFALVNEYLGEKKVYHFDFYRIEKEEELFDIGFDEYISDFNAVKFIEWPYLYPNMLPKRVVKIEIEIQSDTERVISVSSI